MHARSSVTRGVRGSPSNPHGWFLERSQGERITSVPVKAPKKLIEVALPLDDINRAAVREKSIRHGHPSTLHLWWARRPLAAARAVLFAQLVNDPAWGREFGRRISETRAEAERERLFEIIRKLVQWENTNNEAVLAEAREEIWKSWRETCALNRNHPQAAELFNPEKLPAFHDPFAGGGSIPLEAQRLGLEAYASDLNPVAVLINKAMIEIPPKFAGRPPVNPESRKQRRLDEWQGAQGLAEDVRYYGRWMRDEAEKRIGHLYPKVLVTEEMAKDRPDLKKYIGRELTVIAWLWARTVHSPNPAFADVEVPLAASFILSTKPGKEAYIEPLIIGRSYKFVVRQGRPTDPNTNKGTKLPGRATFRCLLSDTPISSAHIKEEGKRGQIGTRLLAVVVEGDRERVYLSPTDHLESIAKGAHPESIPQVDLPNDPRAITVVLYGFEKWADLFTSRQLVALSTLTELVKNAIERIRQDAIDSGLVPDGIGLTSDGLGVDAYAEAIAVYLGISIDRLADRSSNVCSWDIGYQKIVHTFGRQAIQVIWDFAECNPFSNSTGNLTGMTDWVVEFLFASYSNIIGKSEQINAASQNLSLYKIISTDPPYYDNIGYADLSDFFYIWLRQSLKQIYPHLFSTLAVPKADELVAYQYRHNSKEAAEAFFMEGMQKAMAHLAQLGHPAFPTTIYYAFKQTETKDIGTSSTGWETFLESVLSAGFALTGTWPIRTELGNRLRGNNSNALASSIILVCRPRPNDVQIISRKEFLQALKAELPEALADMTQGETTPIAPVDLAQAAIGPGMAVFSRYKAVLEADGTPMSVRTALTLINRALDEYFSEAEGDLDADSQFAIAWFEEFGWAAGAFGQADVLARAKGTSVDGVRDAGVVEAGAGKVRLLRANEYDAGWDPATDPRLATWEALHHLSRALQSGGESEAGTLLAALGAKAAPVRQLAYRLYTLCERKGWAEDARKYNELITSWHAVEAVSHDVATASHGPQSTFDTFGA